MHTHPIFPLAGESGKRELIHFSTTRKLGQGRKFEWQLWQFRDPHHRAISFRRLIWICSDESWGNHETTILLFVKMAPRDFDTRTERNSWIEIECLGSSGSVGIWNFEKPLFGWENKKKSIGVNVNRRLGSKVGNKMVPSWMSGFDSVLIKLWLYNYCDSWTFH